jgi:hypothetical protein
MYSTISSSISTARSISFFVSTTLVVTLNRGEALFAVGFRWITPFLPDSHNLILDFMFPHSMQYLYWHLHMFVLLYWTMIQPDIPFLLDDLILELEVVLAGPARAI